MWLSACRSQLNSVCQFLALLLERWNPMLKSTRSRHFKAPCNSNDVRDEQLALEMQEFSRRGHQSRTTHLVMVCLTFNWYSKLSTFISCSWTWGHSLCLRCHWSFIASLIRYWLDKPPSEHLQHRNVMTQNGHIRKRLIPKLWFTHWHGSWSGDGFSLSPIFKRPNAGSMPLCLANYFILFLHFSCGLLVVLDHQNISIGKSWIQPPARWFFRFDTCRCRHARPRQAPITPDRGNDSSRNQICTESSATPARNSFRTDNPEPTLVCLEKKQVKIPENHPIPKRCYSCLFCPSKFAVYIPFLCPSELP